MNLKHPIHSFQTGRLYTPDGQRLAWVVTHEHDNGWSEVHFYDYDRCIEGRLVLPKAPDAVQNADVLFVYDQGGYRSYIEQPDLKLALRDAAKAVPAPATPPHHSRAH
jgi:hypothetical protein